MSFAPELTVLGYVTDPTRRRVLLVHRIARSSDEQLGKYNGLGGKVESGEDVVAAMRRELMEEAALDATDLELRGTVSLDDLRHGSRVEFTSGDYIVTLYPGRLLD